MKKHNLLTAVMCLLTLAICANAQVASVKANKAQNAKLEKVLLTRVKQARQNVCYKCGEAILDKYHQTCSKGGICRPYPAKASQPDRLSTYTGNKDPHAAPQKVCASCGKEILSDGQHCSANGSTTLCSTVKPKEAEPAEPVASVCPKCGQVLSIDERYHGAKHQCQEVQKTCASCGKEILSDGQHCSANGYTTLCSPVKASKKQASKTKHTGHDPHAHEAF